MDIGTPKEPGRELTGDEARGTTGGQMDPGLEETPPTQSDTVGGGSPMPVDYSTP